MAVRETKLASAQVMLSDAGVETSTPVSPSFQRHYTPAEIAQMWHLSADAVRKIFENEPGVLVLSDVKRGKRRYRTLRIPESVAQRVHGQISLSGK